MTSVVKEIYDRFDRNPVKDRHADYSRIGQMSIEGHANGYRLVARPGNTLLGMNIDVTVPGGIFSTQKPTKVETSPNFGGLKPMKTTPSESPGSMKGKMDSLPAVEGLTLPGDPNFDLFFDLHEQVSRLKSLVADAIATMRLSMEPLDFSLAEKSGKRVYSQATDSCTWHRKVTYDVTSIDYSSIRFELDGSIVTPGSVNLKAPAPDGILPGTLPVFREGAAQLGAQAREELSLDTLLAFSSLQSSIEKIYA